MLMVGLTVFLESCHSTAQYVYIDPRDGKTYKTVKIGKQLWMAENMNYKTAEGSHCFQCKEYGRLYEWNAAQDACPDGWHLPTKAEWNVLFFNRHAKTLKSYEDWYNAEATDRYGFSILPTGRYDDGKLSNRGNFAQFWSADIDEGPYFMPRGDVKWSELSDNKVGVSVRCVRGNKKNVVRKKKDGFEYNKKIESVEYEEEYEEGNQYENEQYVNNQVMNILDTIFDARDGQTYKVVTIGNQTWLAENLKYKTRKSACYADDPSNCEKYGMLYSYEDAQNVCPTGWHLPDAIEWTVLKYESERILMDVLRSSEQSIGSGYTTPGTAPYLADDNLGFPPYACGRFAKTKSCPTMGNSGFSALYSGCLAEERRNSEKYMELGETSAFWYSAKNYARPPVFAANKPQRYSYCASRDVSKLPVRCIKGKIIPLGKTEILKDSRDNKKYKTVKMGNYVWMAENLNYESPDGGSRCYNDKSSMCAKYGRLYSREAAKSACPVGWHLPTDEEYLFLLTLASLPSSVRTGWEVTALRSKKGWGNKKHQNGTDDYGFSVIPGGFYVGYKDGLNRYTGEGKFVDVGERAIFWRSKDDYVGISSIGIDPKIGYSYPMLSIRCVQDY